MSNAQDYYNRAKEAFEGKYYMKALNFINESIKLSYTPIGSAFFLKGDINLFLERYLDALEDYTKVIEIDGNYIGAYQHRGRTYMMMGQYINAVKDFTKVIELDKIMADNYFERGNMYYLLGQFDQANKDYNKAIELDCTIGDYFLNRGACFDSLGQFDLALEDYKKAIELDDTMAEAFQNCGIIYHDYKKFDKAIESFDKAIETNNEFAMAYYNRGRVYHELIQYRKAFDDYTKAVEFDDTLEDAFYSRGNIYYEYNKYESALKDYNNAIRINNNRAKYFKYRGDAYEKLGHFDEAILDFDKSIEIDENYSAAYYNRGLIYKKKENYKKTQADWVRFVHLAENEEIVPTYSELIMFFQYIHPAPYTLRQIFQKMSQQEIIMNIQPYIINMEEQCRIMDSYLDYVGLAKNKKNNQPSEFYALQAYINFYMGTVGVAFEIFDDFLDTQLDYTLSLREEYYFLRSAEAYQKETRYIQMNAIDKAQEVFNTFDSTAPSTSQQAEMYYAGLLFFYTGRLEQAHSCFNKIFLQFYPAAYMQILTLEKLGRQADLEKKIERIRKWEYNQNEPKFLNGLNKKNLTLNEVDFLQPIYDYLFHDELIDAIQLVREPHDAKLSIPALWEAFTLTSQQISNIHSEILLIALKNLDECYRLQLNNTSIMENSHWKDYNAEKDFAELKLLAYNPQELENKISQFILNWNVKKHYYEYYIKYFYFHEQLGVFATYNLYSYLRFIERVKGEMSETKYTFWEKSTEQIFENILSTFVTVTTINFSVPFAIITGVFTKIFINVARDYIGSIEPVESLITYERLKKEIVAGLLADIESQSLDKEAVYKNYVIPELQKWLLQKPKM